eukprot:6455643-Amphidinium_carterae.1
MVVVPSSPSKLFLCMQPSLKSVLWHACEPTCLKDLSGDPLDEWNHKSCTPTQELPDHMTGTYSSMKNTAFLCMLADSYLVFCGLSDVGLGVSGLLLQCEDAQGAASSATGIALLSGRLDPHVA